MFSHKSKTNPFLSLFYSEVWRVNCISHLQKNVTVVSLQLDKSPSRWHLKMSCSINKSSRPLWEVNWVQFTGARSYCHWSILFTFGENNWFNSFVRSTLPRLCNNFIALKGVKAADAKMHKYSKLLRMNLASPMRKVLNFVVLGLHFCFTCSFGTILFFITCWPRTRQYRG